MRVNLGDKVKDKITGIRGIVVARTEWMYGCVRVTVQPQETKDGKPADTVSVDEPACEIVKAAAVADVPQWREPVGTSSRRAAGPRPAVMRRDVAPR